jgi:ABC-type multidrug transport system ATPase subunit
MVGVLSHQTYLYAGLTARENLRFYARLYRLPDAEARITAVLERVGLDGRADDRVGTLSRGLAQRASLARAILHEPRLLLLDEPETGLDDQAQRMLADLIDEWAALGRSLLLTSHRLDWAKALTDRLVVLDRGAIVQADAAALS